MEEKKLNNELEEITENQEIEMISEENVENVEENEEIDEKKENATTTFPIEDTEDRISLKNRLNSLFDDIIISLKNAKVKEDEEKKPKKPKKIMNYNGSVKTLNLKFYAEQLMFGYMSDEELKNYGDDLWKDHQYHLSLKNYGKTTFAQTENNKFGFLFDRFKEVVKNFDDEFQVIGIIHDKDEVADPEDYFKLSSVKSHCHLIIRRKDRTKTFRVNTILKALGIHYRRYIDNELWGYSVSTCKNWQSSVAYLTHETYQAMADGKYIYDREEIFSNCDTFTIDGFREGYNGSAESIRVSQEELEIYDKLFYDKGYDLEDFNSLYNSLSFRIRSNCKMKTIKESYYRGIEERLEKDPPKINRVCLFIQGPPDTGKTYAMRKALRELGYKTYFISGGGTGKFDNLSTTDQAIVIDDTTCGNLLNMTDSRITKAYRRNSNNPYWTGEIFIVTSNLPLQDWCEQCGLRVKNVDYSGTLNQHGIAMKTRFLEYEVVQTGDINQIQFIGDLDDMRGTFEDKQQKLDVANKIISLANETMAKYKKSKTKKLHNDYKVYDEETGKMILKSEQQKKLEEYAEEFNKRNYPYAEYVRTVTYEQLMEEIRNKAPEKYPYQVNDENYGVGFDFENLSNKDFEDFIAENM